MDNIKELELLIEESKRLKEKIKSSSLPDDMKKIMNDDIVHADDMANELLKRMKASSYENITATNKNKVKINSKILFIIILVFLGAMIHGYMGNKFVFVYNGFFVRNKTEILKVFSVFLFFPTIIYINKYSYKDDWMFKYRVIRWLITFPISYFLFPISLALFSFMLYYAPLGWSALATNMLGKDVQSVTVKLKDFSYNKSSKGCKIDGHVEFNSQISELCLSKIYEGYVLNENMEMMADGKQSFLGLYINRLYIINE